MRKKKGHEGHDNAERWLLTYADMITLLMAFFIMMYSMSVLNMAKFRAAAISIRSGFGGIIQGQGKSVLGETGAFSPKPSPIAGDKLGVDWSVVKPLVTYIEKDPNLRKNTQIARDSRGIVVTLLSDDLLFDAGSAEINSRAMPLLDKIAETLDKMGNSIRVEGHTCDLPPRPGSGYPTNWELSTARATNVLRYFVEAKGLDPRLFSAAGYAGLRPFLPNTCEENRRRNRRVEIVIVAGEPAPTSARPVELVKPLTGPVARPIAELAQSPLPIRTRPVVAAAVPPPRDAPSVKEIKPGRIHRPAATTPADKERPILCIRPIDIKNWRFEVNVKPRIPNRTAQTRRTY